ncbi:uncharacterized protein isoform X13 [Leptinotarsa decemlineata]|uniref:uncharacterized protein isoform X13 n=1 Tax=Leptinotarsa decemlineata TaxID=7539 RepID=UPI003D30589A
MDNRNNMLQLCRLCLVKDDVNIPIFEEHGDIRQIFLKISSCLPVKVSREDKLPKKICDGCSFKLDTLYEFCNTSANAEKQLLTWLGEAGMNSQMVDGTITAVTQQIKPTDTFVKEETIEPPDIHNEDDDDKDYMFQQKFEESASAGPSATVTSNEEEEPPPKRARRTAAVKAAIALDHDSDDDDDDSGEPMTKVEDESEESEGEDQEPSFADAPSTSADDQPGPSGVGKDGVEAPFDEQEDEVELDSDTKIQCGMCSKVFPNKKKFVEHSMKLMGEQYSCCKCHAKFKTCMQLYQHYETHKTINSNEIVMGDNDEEMTLNFTEDDEEILVQPSITESNDLFYILDDSSYVNEVEVEVEEDQPTAGAQPRPRRETVEIVNLEHGYVVSNVGGFVDEEVEDGEGNILITRRLADARKPSTSETILSSPRTRNPQPKKRHEVPDFSATNYQYVNANNDIEVPHYKCLRCEQLFINKFGFFRHIEKGKCYINNCDVCTDTFTKNTDFYDHYLAEHTDRAICNFCFRTFMYEKNVKEHMLRHLDQFRHRCEDCNKGFYTVREYRNHYKNRHMGIRHKCEVCGRSFADEYYFKRHIATHAKAASNKAAASIYKMTN